MRKDKKVTEKILNLSLEITYLLTGEEYTIVKKNSPHSSIHQRTGLVDVDGQRDMMDKNHHSLRIPTHRSLGPQDENIDTVNEEEDGIDEQDILQVTIQSDVSAGLSSVKPLFLTTFKQEELNVRGHQQIKEEKIPKNICEISNRDFGGHKNKDIRKGLRTAAYTSLGQVESDTHLWRNVHISPEQTMYQEGNLNVTAMSYQCDQKPCTVNRLIIAEVNDENCKSVKKKKDIQVSKIAAFPNEAALIIGEKFDVKRKQITFKSKLLIVQQQSQKEEELSGYENVFTTESSLVRQLHTDDITSASQECAIGISERAHVNSRYRMNTRAKAYVCPECGKHFSQKVSLNAHHRTHTGEKPFVCPDCGKAFSQRASLNAHHIIHTREESYVCPVCGKGFSNTSSLSAHHLTHTKERTFVCSDCGKGFTQRGNLDAHRRTHTGEKPYVCPQCGKGFSQSTSLNTHYRTHTGEKPFMCPVCKKGFSQRASLNAHHITHSR
ncbi:uncharacterized protein O3C94_011708 [Discoglossus pictus]